MAEFSSDWFSGNIPLWNSLFEKFGMKNRVNKCLEIGTWEGRSAIFTINSLLNDPASRIYCVDTFQGSEEHTEINTSQLYQRCVNNIATTGKQDQVSIIKGSSFEEIPKLFKDHSESFDFIYIDGSHTSLDVLLDALNCFKLLKVGGIMIFDDYLWDHYSNPYHNPKIGIDTFLMLMSPYTTIICRGYQMSCIKIKSF